MPAEPPTMPEDDALLALLDAAAVMHGIPVDPAWRAEILANFRAVGNAARAFLSFPLDDEAEPAPVFRA